MDTSSVLQMILLVAGIVACAAVVYVAYEAVGTLRSTRRFFDDTHERLMPLMDKVDVTVDAANAELLRIDAIVTQFEEVSDRVSSTTAAVQEAVHAPREAVTAVGSGIRTAYVAWRRGRRD